MIHHRCHRCSRWWSLYLGSHMISLRHTSTSRVNTMLSSVNISHAICLGQLTKFKPRTSRDQLRKAGPPTSLIAPRSLDSLSITHYIVYTSREFCYQNWFYWRNMNARKLLYMYIYSWVVKIKMEMILLYLLCKNKKKLEKRMKAQV